MTAARTLIIWSCLAGPCLVTACGGIAPTAPSLGNEPDASLGLDGGTGGSGGGGGAASMGGSGGSGPDASRPECESDSDCPGGSCSVGLCTNACLARDDCNTGGCATDNGGCGPAEYYSCLDPADAPPSCSDIDECATNNGGCGSPLYYACTNLVGAAPLCADIDECANDNGGCDSQGFLTCNNRIGAPRVCSPAADAGTELTDAGGLVCDAFGTIFAQKCGGSQCHGAGAINGDFAASREASAASVGQVSGRGGDCGLVIDPEDPENSLILTMSNGVADPAFCFPVLMPLGAEDLSQDELDCILDWLTQFGN